MSRAFAAHALPPSRLSRAARSAAPVAVVWRPAPATFPTGPGQLGRSMPECSQMSLTCGTHTARRPRPSGLRRRRRRRRQRRCTAPGPPRTAPHPRPRPRTAVPLVTGPTPTRKWQLLRPALARLLWQAAGGHVAGHILSQSGHIKQADRYES